MSEARTFESKMTPDEFFVWQAEQDHNFELVDGWPVMTVKAMTGASIRHDTITVNVLTSLRNQLRGKPCRPHTDDIAIRNPNNNVRRPDILVDCQRGPDLSTEVVEPRVLIEVLSPSTMRFDRLVKVEEYKAHPAVRVILLLASETAEAVVWRRTDDRWVSEIVDRLGAVIALPEIGASLAMADIYEDTGASEPGPKTR